MAAVIHGVSTASTDNASSYASGSFAPAANDLLVAFVGAAATLAAAPTMVDSQGLGFTLVRSFPRSGNTAYVFVANALAAASSMTVTFDCTGDGATGAVIQVARVSGMTLVGIAAIRNSGGFDGAASTTPTGEFVAFGSSLTTNPTLGMVMNSTNPAGLTEPSGWTERDDTGFNTPSSGAQYVSRDSGFAGTTITWGGTSASQYCGNIIEMDSSVAGYSPAVGPMALTGAGSSLGFGILMPDEI